MNRSSPHRRPYDSRGTLTPWRQNVGRVISARLNGERCRHAEEPATIDVNQTTGASIAPYQRSFVRPKGLSDRGYFKCCSRKPRTDAISLGPPKPCPAPFTGINATSTLAPLSAAYSNSL